MPDHPRTIVPVDNAQFSRDTLDEAGRLAKTAPERLTDLHLSHLCLYVTPKVLTEVIQRRDAAILARAVAVQQRADQAFAAAQQQQQQAADAQAAGERQVAAAREHPDLVETPEQAQATLEKGIAGLMAHAARHPDAPTPLQVFAGLTSFVMAINKKNIARNARLDALELRATAAETRAQALEQRLDALRVELEADRAVRS